MPIRIVELKIAREWIERDRRVASITIEKWYRSIPRQIANNGGVRCFVCQAHGPTLGVNNPQVKNYRGHLAPSVPDKIPALPRMCWGEDPCPACRAYGFLADGSPIPGEREPAPPPLQGSLQ